MLLGPAPTADLNDWRRMIDINLMGLMYSTHAAIPHLVKAAAEEPRQVADIVNIGSLAGRNAYAMSAVYSATKFGVGALSESLRQELARQHVRVSVVELGSVDTELRTHNPAAVQQHISAAWATSSGCRARTSPTPSATSSPAPGTWPSPSCSYAHRADLTKPVANSETGKESADC